MKKEKLYTSICDMTLHFPACLRMITKIDFNDLFWKKDETIHTQQFGWRLHLSGQTRLPNGLDQMDLLLRPLERNKLQKQLRDTV